VILKTDTDCDYAASTHYVFDVDELVRYIKFREVLAEKGRCTQGQLANE